MMRDCQNADVRDRLPDLVHDLLSTGERETVLAHVSSCADCTAEVALLRELRVALFSGGGTSVDVAGIVAALPAPSRAAVADAKVVSLVGRRAARRGSSWRVAAAIATLMIGGTSVGILARQGREEGPTRVAVETPAAVAPAAVPADPSASPAAPAAVASSRSSGAPAASSAATDVGLAADAVLADASDAELTALIDDIEHFDGTPIAEPEPVAPVGTNNGTGGAR